MNLAELEEELLAELWDGEPPPPRLVVRWGGLLEPTVDMLSAVITLGWCILFFVKADIFAAAPGYAALAALATPSNWAVLLLFSTALQLLGVIVRKPPIRLVAQTGAAAQWFFMCIMFSQASVGGVKTGAVTYGAIAVFLLIRTLVKSEK